MTRLHLPRRRVLKWLGVALVIPFSSPFLLKTFAKDGLQNDGFPAFLEVSAALLGITASELDSDVARVYWSKLYAIEGMKAQILQLHQAILKTKFFKSNSQLPVPSQAIAKQLLRIWYTGVIDIPQSSRQRLFYDDALMFKLFLKDRPAPGNCLGASESWTKIPF